MSSRLNLALASMLQRETHGVGEQKQPFKNIEIRGGRGAPKYPLEQKFQGGGGGVVGKSFGGGVWTFSATTQCYS